jgi:hypothetical protein
MLRFLFTYASRPPAVQGALAVLQRCSRTQYRPFLTVFSPCEPFCQDGRLQDLHPRQDSHLRSLEEGTDHRSRPEAAGQRTSSQHSTHGPSSRETSRSGYGPDGDDRLRALCPNPSFFLPSSLLTLSSHPSSASSTSRSRQRNDPLSPPKQLEPDPLRPRSSWMGPRTTRMG